MPFTLNNSFGQDRFLNIFKWRFKKCYFKLCYAVSGFPNILPSQITALFIRILTCTALFNTYTRTDKHFDV